MLTSQERNTRKTIALEALEALVLDTLSRTSLTSIDDLKAAERLCQDYRAAVSYINLVSGWIK